MNKKIDQKKVAFIGMLGALSMVLMLFQIPLPFVLPFIKFDISELPALFAAFFMGPLSGCMVVVVKILLNLVLTGTDTAFVGELSNLIGNCIFVALAGNLYKKNKSKKGAVIAMAVSTVVVSVAYVITNVTIIFPMYVTLYGMPWEAIIEMGHKVNALVTDKTSLMLFSVLPFNLFKYAVTSTLTFILYKKCGNALRKVMEPKKVNNVQID